MNSLVTQAVTVISALGGLGAVLTVFADKRKRAAEARKIEREGGKADAEGQVAISGQTLEWARDYRQEAKEAKLEAKDAWAEAREARARADQCARDRDNDRERIEDLEAQVAKLTERLAHYEQV